MHIFSPRLLALLALLPAGAVAQPYGIETREPNTELIIDDLPVDTPGSMNLQRVYPDLSFAKALLMIEAPDDSGRLFVVSQTGVIDVFQKNPAMDTSTKQTFLDISGRTYDSGERGLLGMAFSPDYATSGEFYVSYVTFGGNGVSRVSRFTNDNPADNSVDSSTDNEEIILSLSQPYTNHNGGMIAFGPDDMLYYGMGDGGDARDPEERAQDTTNWFGSMLRIDVLSAPDPGKMYAVPPDNPFVSGGPAGTSTLPEIYAYGLRNPWRFSFDMVNGFLIAGDVGQGAREEVTVIRSGENHGWDIMEGFICHEPSSGCDQTGLTLPIDDYPRSVGQSITGGFVYYGALNELYGTYVYGDYATGIILGLQYDGENVTGPNTLVQSAGFNIAGFGQDSDGEVYVLERTSGETGGIYVFTPAGTPQPNNFPTRLSDLPALFAAGSGDGHNVDGVFPYEPSAKLWSDGAHKERYFATAGTDTVGYTEVDGWDFPNGTAIVKNFLLPLDRRDPEASLKRIETRLMLRLEGQWHGFTYEWNETETDAQLLTTNKTRDFNVIDEDGAPTTQTWYYPSRTDCFSCHTPEANFVLGLNTAQMNYDLEYPSSGVTDNQLRTLDHISIFDMPLPDTPENLPRMPDSNDTSASIRDRARAYLAANCAMCHRPDSNAPALIDLRWETADVDMDAIDVTPQNGNIGLGDAARIIAPGDAVHSVLLERMKRLDNTRMPPLASSVVDQEAVDLITDWINQIEYSNVDSWMLR